MRGMPVMDSSCSTPSSSRSRMALGSRLPHHLQQPSSSNSGPAVHTASIHTVRPGQSYVTVQTLNKDSLVIVVTPKTRVHDVLWKCGEILEIADNKLFGLALRQPTEGIGGDQPRHEYFFLDPAQKIVKYAPKQPRFTNWHNRSAENRPLLVLYFRVRVYIDNVRLITCGQTLEHYYLQLKDNFLDQWSGSHSVSEERCWEMAALALKTDKGDNDASYFRAEQYFPMWVIDLRGLEFIRTNMPAASADLKDIERKEAMTKFCIEASRSPFALNCHLYGLRRHKMDSVDNAVLGINARGIEMCDIGEDGDRVPLRSLSWSKVNRLSFDRKKLTILGSDGTKMSLYAQTESKARYLLELCRAVHQTLLVLSHATGRIVPSSQQSYAEKSVDRVSTSSSPVDHDAESLLHGSFCGDRLHGSVNSKTRIRIKLDSNLELKIEKMELESIRQDRASSQSSKTSDLSEQRDPIARTRASSDEAVHIPAPTANMPAEIPRPASIDSASQTVEMGLRQIPLDVNCNAKFERCDSALIMEAVLGNHPTYAPENQCSSSTGSRSGSVQHSTELLPNVAYHPEQIYRRSEDDVDSTLRATIPPQSLSLHDLRQTGEYNQLYVDQLHGTVMQRSVSPNGKPRWTTVGGLLPTEQPMTANLVTSQARSEPRMDSDLWTHPSVSAALLDATATNGARRFTKRTNSGASRINAAAINRVHSMPAHYHMMHGYQRSSPTEDYPPASSLHHAHSMNNPRSKVRDPPSYDRVVTVPAAAPQSQPLGINGVPPSAGPMPAETPGGQASFPPASVTPTQFSPQVEGTYFNDEEGMSTERLRDFPMMQRLWRESHGMLSHHRRPSSCIDLSSDLSGSPSRSAFLNGTHRGDYVIDTAIPFVPQGVARSPSTTHNSFGFRNPAANLLPLPPPPPYPSSRKAPLMV